MSNYLSPNMSLVIPVPTEELGPNWAYDLNASLTILDGHNHTAGSGVQIPTAAMNINADLSFNNAYNLVGARSTRFYNNASALVGTQDLGCIYEAGGDFYYNNSSGTVVQITSGSSVAGSTGTITGLPNGTASASYQSGTGSFQFLQATSTAANLDVATVAIRYPGSYPTLSGNYIAIQAPSSLASAYSITLPALPAQTNVMTLGSSGVIGSVTYDAVASSMTSVGADSIAASMNSTGANAIAASMTATGANAIAASISSVSSGVADLVGSAMSSTGANAVASTRTRSVSSTVAAGGVAISSSCGVFTTTSTSYVDVTNLSVTLTTTGRPVCIMLSSDGSGNKSLILTVNNANPADVSFNIVRILSGTPTTIYTMETRLQASFTGNLLYLLPPGSINQIDAVAAGTYTYTLQAASSNGVNIAGISYAKLIAYEL